MKNSYVMMALVSLFLGGNADAVSGFGCPALTEDEFSQGVTTNFVGVRPGWRKTGSAPHTPPQRPFNGTWPQEGAEATSGTETHCSYDATDQANTQFILGIVHP